jgi:hypothetical protein
MDREPDLPPSFLYELLSDANLRIDVCYESLRVAERLAKFFEELGLETVAGKKQADSNRKRAALAYMECSGLVREIAEISDRVDEIERLARNGRQTVI